MKATSYTPRLGLEMEMAVADAATGASLPVTNYFAALQTLKQEKGQACEQTMLADRCVGLHTPVAECGLDNGFNLLETALAPVDASAGGLSCLAQRAHAELADTITALRSDGGCVLNVSQHPACPRDQNWYQRVCVPRPIYNELRDFRGWHHWEGINAQAQNGANTSVPVADAVTALNAAIALAPASIALFANSPLEFGAVSGYKETRMILWERMFAPARFTGDLRLSRYPERPFRDLADFFAWMHGAGTVSRGLPLMPSRDYKSVPTVLLDGNPSLLEFLRRSQWPGRRTDNNETVMLAPATHHFEYGQIGQFLDARLRFRFDAAMPELTALLAAWQRADGLETLFADHGVQVYIEARAPGAGFADACLLHEAGFDIARSVLIAPTALQAGLLADPVEALRIVERWGWARLGELRMVAMRDGLDDARIRALCTEVLDVARAGLVAPDRVWLAYAGFVLATGRTGADRLLDTWRSTRGGLPRHLGAVVARHAALKPQQFL